MTHNAPLLHSDLAHKPQHLLHCVRISERPENTDQQHNFSFIGLKSPNFLSCSTHNLSKKVTKISSFVGFPLGDFQGFFREINEDLGHLYATDDISNCED